MRGGGIGRSEEEENGRREEALAPGSKAGSDRKVVVDSFGRHPTGLWDESRLRVAGQPGAFGVNFCVGTPSRRRSESRQFSQNCVRLPSLPLSVLPFSFLSFFLPIY